MVLTRVPWKNCTFLNFDKTKLERKYFFGTFDNCEFDNIYFTTRDLRITYCVVQNSLMMGSFSRTWIDQCVLENTHFKNIEFYLMKNHPGTNVLFDRKYFHDQVNERKKDKYVDYTMTQLHNCHFDKIQLRRTKIESSDTKYNRETIPSELRLIFPYEGLETCSFTVLLLSNSTLSSKSKWLGAALPSQIVRPNVFQT